MAYRTTYTAVGKIIEIDSSFDSDAFEPFIETANALVTECCSTDDYDAARLELIERYLAAHFYTLRDPRAETEKAGSVSVKYQSKVELGFDTSHYGQMAMRLDTAGGLAKINAQAKGSGVPTVSLTHMGKDTTNNEDISVTM